MSITEYRLAYKPFEYPKYFEYFKKTIGSVWRPEEVSMDADIRDWQYNTTTEEKEVIQGILRGFTQLECYVGCHWADRVCKIFPKHEIVAMARAFSTWEGIHAQAYNYLSDTLGLNEFEAFLGDPIARKKIDYFLNETSDKVSLAIFSGAGEGVSLFSSFAVLLSFNLSGRFKGLGQIISWSVLDEQLHSDAGCELFKDLREEQGLTNNEKNSIWEGFNAIVDNEFAFIDNIFKSGSIKIEGVTQDNLKHYILSRANNRLNALGIDGNRFSVDSEKAESIRGWFEPLVKGQASTDFFHMSKDGGNYVAKAQQNFEIVNYSELNLELI